MGTRTMGAFVATAAGLFVAGCVLAACGARSSLDVVVGAGGAPASRSTSTEGEDRAGAAGGAAREGDGGALPFDCGPELTLTDPASFPASGDAGRVVPVFASNDGAVVSLFVDVVREAGVRGLEGFPVEPWGDWPPIAGAAFLAEASGGETFTAATSSYGAVALLFQHDDPDPSASALRFANALAGTAPSGFVAVDVATAAERPRAIALARGYDVPPVAVNEGYMAMIATWEIQRAPGVRALRMGVGASGVYPLLAGAVTRPDEPDLACANGPIAGDAVRLGNAWLVAAGTATGLQRCSGSIGAPTTLAVDRVAWGAVDAVDWSLSRASSTEGEGTIVGVRMVADATTAWVLVRREAPGGVELVHLDASGAVLDVVRDFDDGPFTEATIARLGEGLLIATVAEGDPATLGFQLRDGRGVVRSRGAVRASANVASPALLASASGDAVVAAWTEDSPAAPTTHLARIGCTPSEAP